MLGDELMSTPILKENRFERTILIPKGINFYDFHNGQYY